jgi:hypothetical protein
LLLTIDEMLEAEAAARLKAAFEKCKSPAMCAEVSR